MSLEGSRGESATYKGTREESTSLMIPAGAVRGTLNLLFQFHMVEISPSGCCCCCCYVGLLKSSARRLLAVASLINFMDALISSGPTVLTRDLQDTRKVRPFLPPAPLRRVTFIAAISRLSYRLVVHRRRGKEDGGGERVGGYLANHVPKLNFCCALRFWGQSSTSPPAQIVHDDVHRAGAGYEGLKPIPNQRLP